MVEIEVDEATNGGLLFHPAGERVRGRFDPARVASDDIGTLVRQFPRGVPGQVIAYDPATNTGYIREPLLDPANADVKAAVEKKLTALSPGQSTVDFGTAVREYPTAHAGTWLGWMARAVRSGVARVVKGKLPESDPPDMKRGFYTSEPKADPRDATITQLVGLLTAKLTPAERKELAAVLGSK
jgi:hypothetical protein